MNSTGNQTQKYEIHKNIPSLNYILIISLGLIFIALVSSTFVYAESTTVDVEGNTFDIEYTGNGVSVSGVEADLDFISLIFTVDVTSSPGTWEVTFERSFKLMRGKFSNHKTSGFFFNTIKVPAKK